MFFFVNLKTKVFSNYIELDRRQHRKYDKMKEKNEHNSVFKVFTNNDN